MWSAGPPRFSRFVSASLQEPARHRPSELPRRVAGLSYRSVAQPGDRRGRCEQSPHHHCLWPTPAIRPYPEFSRPSQLGTQVRSGARGRSGSFRQAPGRFGAKRLRVRARVPAQKLRTARRQLSVGQGMPRLAEHSIQQYGIPLPSITTIVGPERYTPATGCRHDDCFTTTT